LALAAGLTGAGFTPKQVRTTAQVHIDKVGTGFKITRIDLQTEAEVPGIYEQQFQEIAEATKKGCPVSQALSAVEINLQAKLVQ
jgi:osmotically inducible protein OsmC